MGTRLRWMIYLLLFTFYQGIVYCQRAQGHKLDSKDSFAAEYPNIQAELLLQQHPLWYKHFRSWDNQAPRQENVQSAYRRDSLYHLEREQLDGNKNGKFSPNNAQPNMKSLNQPYIPVREVGLNGRERGYGTEGRKPNGQITVKVYNSPSIKDVEEEEHLDNSAGGQSTILSASHSVQNIIDHLKQQEKKSPDPVQDESASSLSYAANNSPVAQFQKTPKEEEHASTSSFSDVYFVAIVAGCSAVAIFGVVASGYCFYKLQKRSKAAVDVDYPAYGVTGPSKETTSPNGDRKLAQSAQMYHYQHQKQQMIAVEKATSTHHASTSDIDSEEENEEGDYTVYECPGLAPTGEMEVKNPLFNDDSTPISPPIVTPKPPEK